MPASQPTPLAILTQGWAGIKIQEKQTSWISFSQGLLLPPPNPPIPAHLHQRCRHRLCIFFRAARPPDARGFYWVFFFKGNSGTQSPGNQGYPP
jgi:hypothetical protein